jgi:hypothetical protein
MALYKLPNAFKKHGMPSKTPANAHTTEKPSTFWKMKARKKEAGKTIEPKNHNFAIFR